MSADEAILNTTAPRINWLLEAMRSLTIVLGATFIGLVANMFSPKPVPLFSNKGPGAFIEEAPRISIADLREALAQKSPPLLIDARGEYNYAKAHPSGAINLGPREFMQKYEKFAPILKAAPEIVVLCESEECPLADETAKLLIDLKYRKIRVLFGGWKAYKTSGLPVESASPDVGVKNG